MENNKNNENLTINSDKTRKKAKNSSQKLTPQIY